MGDETIGTLDGLYEELWSHTTWPEFPGLGQNLIALKNAANEYIATEAAEIKSNVSIDYDSFDVNQAKSDIDNNLPIILGMSSISADASSYHVVVAYGYATINDVDGFIVHYGHRANKVQIFVPTSYFSFQLRMSVAHLHTFVPILDENGSSIIDNYYKIIKCTECHSVQVDELYDTNRDNNIITGLKYAPIKNVSIPSSYKGIGDGVFKGTDIETLAFSNSDFKIGDSAFENCESLSTISGTSKISHIGKYAFRSCGKLKHFTIGASVSSIGQGAFAGCNNCDINVVGGNENFCSEGNIVYNKDRTTIFASGKTASVFDFSAIRTIVPSAFESNNRVTKLVFDQVDIGDRAFYGCANMTEVYFDGFSMAELGRDCFTNDSFIAYVPYFMQSSYQYALSTYTENIVSRQFCVTYFSDGVQKDATTNYYGEIVSNMPIVIKNGYTFDGWYKAEDYSSGKISEGADEKWQEKDDIVLYAKWNANTYTISFEGTGCENLKHQDVVFNERIGELPIPTQIGYEFEGWKDETGKAVSANDIYQTAGNIILFPIWSAKTYTITFHACGGSPEIEIKHCKYNDIFTAFPNVERNGYSLKEWNSAEDGNGKQYKSGFAFSFDSDLNLYAQWNVITYSIVYAMNGGVNSASNPTVYTIDSNDIILNPATKSGYSFVGWKKDGSIITKIEKGSFGNIELMAIWQANTYTVTLDANGGVLNGNNTLTVTYDESFAIENGISREGYDFLGWCDIDGVRYANSNGECVKKWDKTENTTLIAEWLVKSYEIQINNNNTITWIGPNGLSTVKSPISYGTVINTINLIAVFKESSQGYKEGHIFDHFEYGNTKMDWDTVPDLGDNGAIITIIPIWKKEKHTIHFQTKVPELLIPPITIEYDDIVSLPKDVNRDGYEFNGWSQTDGGSLVSWTRMPDLTPGAQDNGSIDLFAVYIPIEYTIRYVLYDGINAQENPLTYNITQNIILRNPSKTGYIFDGWFSDSSFSSKINSISGMSGNKTLHAKWIPIKYTIYYHSNEASSLEISEHEYNKYSKLRPNTFEKQGYSFSGWATSENSSVQYGDCENIMNLSAINNDVINLYAVWTANTYQIEYIANGGYGVMPNSKHVYDKVSNLNGCQYERTGYSFVGWSLFAQGEKVYSDGDSVINLISTPNGVASLYAMWEPNTYTITFDMQGGNGGTSTIIATYDAELSDIVPPERKGFIFKGYFDGKQASGKQYYKGGNPSKGVSKYDRANNITLYAFWEKQYYDVTIYNEDDSVFRVVQVAFGEQMPEFAVFAPKKSGYKFNGYFTEKNGKGIKYYTMAYRNDEQTAMIEGTNYHYCEQIDSCRKMDQYNGFSLYPSFSSLELDYIYNIFCDNDVVATQKIHVSGKDKSTTVIAPAVNGYSFSHFMYGFKQYNDSTSTIPFTLSRSNSDKDGRVELGYVFSAVYTKNQDSCVAPGTLITLANGARVPVETLTGNERLLVWNMLTGEFDSAPIVFVDNEPLGVRDVIRLSFSDGTIVQVISEHAFWDVDMNQYVYLDENAAQYIGHYFNKQTFDDNGIMTWIGVQLTDVSITKEETTAWSPVTYCHLCYYVNGMLSIPGGISGLFNYLSVDSETMTINQEALAEDIEQYGLFTYEELSELVTITPEVFDAFNGQYLKIAIGKGMITIDEIQSLLDRYARFF